MSEHEAQDNGNGGEERAVSNGEAEAEASASIGLAESPVDNPSEEAAAADDPAVVVPTEREQLTAERNKLKDQLLRTAADYDNFRKRSRREIEDVRKRTQEDTLREVLPVIDNLERASAAATEATDMGAVLEGVKMVLRGFEDVALRLGLSRIATVGAHFDPTVHDAVQQLETDQHAPGTIVAEVVSGYKLGDKLLRPAMVVVARPPVEATEAEPSGEQVGDEEAGSSARPPADEEES